MTGLQALCLAYNDFTYLAEVLVARGDLDAFVNRDIVDGWIAKPLKGKEPLLTKARANAGANVFPAVQTPENDPFLRGQNFGIDYYKNLPASYSALPAHNRTTYFVTKEPIRNVIWNIRFALVRTAPRRFLLHEHGIRPD